MITDKKERLLESLLGKGFSLPIMLHASIISFKKCCVHFAASLVFHRATKHLIRVASESEHVK